jgi:hypothetical protein
MRGKKTGGRQKGTKNKAIRDEDRKYLPRYIAIKLAKLDQTRGLSMAEIQLAMARMVLKHTELQEKLGNIADAIRYGAIAAKIAHDVSPFLYPSQQAIKHSGTRTALRSASRRSRISSWKS